MANDVITYTKNYGFALIDKSQDQVKFFDFRDLLCGVDESNMIKIDAALFNLQNSVTDLIQIDEDELKQMLVEVLV